MAKNCFGQSYMRDAQLIVLDEPRRTLGFQRFSELYPWKNGRSDFTQIFHRKNG